MKANGFLEDTSHRESKRHSMISTLINFRDGGGKGGKIEDAVGLGPILIVERIIGTQIAHVKENASGLYLEVNKSVSPDWSEIIAFCPLSEIDNHFIKIGG